MPGSKLAPRLERWLQSRLRIRFDTLVVAIVATLVSIATIRLELFERLHHLAKGHEHYELDELILVAIIWCLAAVVYAGLRGAELKAEVRIREESERQANALARYDPLTGLANRRLLIEHIDEVRARRTPGLTLAVMLIDLDRFKPVNDLYGHDAGDTVLIEIAKRFARIAASEGQAMVARMGGDEFACVIEYDSESDAASPFAQRAIDFARMPIATTGATVTIGASIGIAIDCSPSADTAELLRMADHAMYQAKAAGRNAVRVFDAAMDATARSATLLEVELRAGVAKQQFVPHYQPIANLSDDSWRGFECLARWNHPARGLLGAEQFIAVAEGSDLFDALAMALLDQACADARSWPAHFTMSFNISPIQLRNAWLPEQILRTLAKHGLAPGRLIIELTESGLFADIENARTIITSLKNAGVKFALDDFGTGYSSLSHLSQLPFDIIKIDRSFIENVDIEAHDSIVKAIVRMGHSLGMKVTAEGVSCERNRLSLKNLECDFAQGFLIGYPLGASDTENEIAARLTEQAPRRRASR